MGNEDKAFDLKSSILILPAPQSLATGYSDLNFQSQFNISELFGNREILILLCDFYLE